MLEEMNTMYNPWNNLQQPLHASSGIPASFRFLLTAIDQGWQVEEPVEVMVATQGNAWIYSFVMTHPISGHACRLYASATQEIERLVEQNHYQVIETSLFESIRR